MVTSPGLLGVLKTCNGDHVIIQKSQQVVLVCVSPPPTGKDPPQHSQQKGFTCPSPEVLTSALEPESPCLAKVQLQSHIIFQPPLSPAPNSWLCQVQFTQQDSTGTLLLRGTLPVAPTPEGQVGPWGAAQDSLQLQLYSKCARGHLLNFCPPHSPFLPGKETDTRWGEERRVLTHPPSADVGPAT